MTVAPENSLFIQPVAQPWRILSFFFFFLAVGFHHIHATSRWSLVDSTPLAGKTVAVWNPFTADPWISDCLPNEIVYI